MPLSASALAFVFVVLAILSLWAWLIVAAKIALSRNWIRGAGAENAAKFITSLGLAPTLPLVAWTPRHPVPWGFVDLIVLMCVCVVTSAAAGTMLGQMGLIDRDLSDDALALRVNQTMVVGNAVVSIGILAIGLPLVALRSGATLADLGFPKETLLTDLRTGLIGFVLLAPPVYALQGLLVYFWKPSTHPLMEMFKESPNVWFFAVLFISAAIVAPLFEELIFRVLLQGFLEKAVTLCGDATEILIGGRSTAAPDAESVAVVANVLEPNDSVNPYAPPQELIPGAQVKAAITLQPELRGLLAWGSITISSAIFAILHYTHGPDWIPLFFLACGMGYLYQRTHRIIPSLTVHVLLNSLSMWALWVQVHTKDLQP